MCKGQTNSYTKVIQFEPRHGSLMKYRYDNMISMIGMISRSSSSTSIISMISTSSRMRNSMRPFSLISRPISK